MAWQPPKTDWTSADVPLPADFNRIEENTQVLRSDLDGHKSAATLDHPDGSVTDAKLGNRTANQAQAPTGSTGTLTQLLSWIANRIKAITGAANWYDNPATTLAAAKSHMDAAAPHSGHETPSGAQAKVDAHSGAASGVHGVGTSYVAKTSRSDQLPSWADIPDKPAAFPPAAHTHHGADVISPVLDSIRVSGFYPDPGTTAGTIPVRDASGKLPGSITGDAVTVGGRAPGVANGLATLNASGLVAQDSAYTSGVSGFTPSTVKAALDALARAEHATDAVVAFRAYQGTPQALAAGAFTKIAFETEVFDQGSVYDPATYRFTVPSPGIYLVTAYVGFDAVPDGNRAIVAVYVNGNVHSRLATEIAGSLSYEWIGGSVPLKLQAGQYIEVYAYSQNAVQTNARPDGCYFTAVRIA